jgi:hypothetical protein
VFTTRLYQHFYSGFFAGESRFPDVNSLPKKSEKGKNALASKWANRYTNETLIWQRKRAFIRQ